jgi:hypothetical protein
MNETTVTATTGKDEVMMRTGKFYLCVNKCGRDAEILEFDSGKEVQKYIEDKVSNVANYTVIYGYVVEDVMWGVGVGQVRKTTTNKEIDEL